MEEQEREVAREGTRDAAGENERGRGNDAGRRENVDEERQDGTRGTERRGVLNKKATRGRW